MWKLRTFFSDAPHHEAEIVDIKLTPDLAPVHATLGIIP
jgi:hypothetical protein